MTTLTPTTRVDPFGDHSLMLTLAGALAPASFVPHLRQALPATVTIRVGLNALLLTFPGITTDTRPALDRALLQVEASLAPASCPTTRHVIPVTYTGADLGDVADQLNLAPQQVIAAHTSLSYRVALIGFAPGFPYLVPEDPANPAGQLLATIARRGTPRQKVPAGSVGLAAGMSAIYPSSMPGGWNLLGHTDVALFDSSNASPSLLNVGDLITFRTATS